MNIFEPVHEILKHYEYTNKKNIHTMPQGPPNPGFMQEKVQKKGFFKKAIARIEIFLLF